MSITWSEYLVYGVVDPHFRDNSTELSPPRFNNTMFPKGINADFYNVDDKPPDEIVSSFSERFENPESRDIAKASEKILEVLRSHAGLAMGMTIVDIGCGTGLFLQHLSKAVGPTGKVIANEVSDVFFRHLEQRTNREGYTNVQLVKGDAKNPGLSVNSADVVFICDVYHHFEYPKTIIRQIRQSLKPTGKLVILDFIRDDNIHTSHAKGWVLQHV